MVGLLWTLLERKWKHSGGDYKVLPVSEKAFTDAKILRTFSQNVSSVYLTLFTEDEGAEEMSIGLYCGYRNGCPVVMIHNLMLQ